MKENENFDPFLDYNYIDSLYENENFDPYWDYNYIDSLYEDENENENEA